MIDHLVPLLKGSFPDSIVVKDLKLNRTKATAIIKNVIAKNETNNLAEQLRKVPFSVLIDESTDVSLHKLLCINTKFVNEHGVLCDRLLEIVTVDAKNSDAEHLFCAFKNCLETKQIPLKNVIGFASDNASVMIGKHNSFLIRLQSETEALVVLPCICHSSALVASKACAKLPRTPEEFIRSIASYFSVSAKRSAELIEMQEFFLTEQKKMVKLCTTRWLCMQHAVKRVLENWEVLYRYFQLASVEDNSKNIDFIFGEFNNSCTKAILLFLNYILNFFNIFNALFQGKKILINILSTECKKLLRQVISHFIKPEYAKDLRLNFSNPRYFVDIKSVDLGPQCNLFIRNLPEDIQISIKKSCLDFLIVAATEMQSRFPITDVFFDTLLFLSPHIALNTEKPVHLQSLEIISNKFKSLSLVDVDSNLVDLEWKKIAVYFDEGENKEFKKQLIDKSVEVFWQSLENLQNFQDEPEFSNIARLAKLCLSLPHSNAETERVFSVVTDVKTKKRNKLSSEVLNSIAVIRFSTDNCCQNFNVSNKHLKLMASENLYK